MDVLKAPDAAAQREESDIDIIRKLVASWNERAEFIESKRFPSVHKIYYVPPFFLQHQNYPFRSRYFRKIIINFY